MSISQSNPLRSPHIAYYPIVHNHVPTLGGIESHTVTLAQSIGEAGLHLSGILPVASLFDPLDAAFRRSGFDTYRLRPIVAETPAQLMRNWLDLCRLLIRLRPDLLHLQRSYPWHGKWSVLAARIARIPILVATDHDLPVAVGRVGRQVNRAIDRLLDAVIVVSDYNRRAQLELTDRPDRIIHRIYNGIDLGNYPMRRPEEIAAARALFHIPPGAPVVGITARLVEVKRHCDLLEAVARLAEQCPDLHVLISGDGPLRESLEAQASALGLAGRVRFLGFHPNAAEVLHALDLFVLPSSWEAFGLVAAEAMATGVPVVASRTGGLPEVVTHDETGLLVPIGDVGALAAAIERGLRDEPLRQRMALAGRQRAERLFSKTTMADNTLRLYRQLFAQKRIPFRWPKAVTHV
jgi:glycosyltransferase involved in cell wall biosynthesis